MLGEVLPARIRGLDQSDLLASLPAFDFFFSSDRAENLSVFLKEHKPSAAVFACESLEVAALMLLDTMIDIIRHAGVEGAAVA